MQQTVEVSWNGEGFNISKRECFKDRGDAIESLISLALLKITNEEKRNLKNFSMKVWTGDYPTGIDALPGTYAFCYPKYSNMLAPDFNFMNWPSVGVMDYEETCKNIIEESKKPFLHSQLFWAGSGYTNKARGSMIEMTKNDKRMSINDVGHWKGSETSSGFFVSLPNHCHYKYLIDIQGWGYSGRVKHLLHSKRPLFFQERDCNEYWFFDLEPFVHYIPVKKDLSDFYEKFEWCEKNYGDCIKIAENAQNFAINNLRRQNAVDKYKEIIIDKKK